MDLKSIVSRVSHGKVRGFIACTGMYVYLLRTQADKQRQSDIHTCTQTHTYTHTHAYIQTHPYIHKQIRIYCIHTHRQTHTITYKYTHAETHKYVYKQTHTCIYTCISTQLHTVHAHINMNKYMKKKQANKTNTILYLFISQQIHQITHRLALVHSDTYKSPEPTPFSGPSDFQKGLTLPALFTSHILEQDRKKNR